MLALLTCVLGSAVFVSTGAVFAQGERPPTPEEGSTPLTTSDWTMFDFHHSRFNASEQRLSRTNVSQLSLAWSHATGTGTTTEMVVASGIVYTTSPNTTTNAFLDALSEQTGQLLWQRALPSRNGPIGGRYYLSVADGLVYLNDGAFAEAYTAATGTPVWSRAIDPLYAMVIQDGVLYVQSMLGSPQGQSSMYALNAHTGKTLWSVILAQNLYSSSPTVADGTVYIGDVDGTLIALNATNGQTRWTASLGTNTAIITAPVVNNGLVFVEGDSTGLFAFSARTGKQRWFVPSDPYTGSPAVAYGMVYVPEGQMQAYNEQTGKLVWHTTGTDLDYAATVANEVVYASASNGGTIAFAAQTGKVLYTYNNMPYQGQNNSSSIIADGMVFFTLAYGYTDALKLP